MHVCDYEKSIYTGSYWYHNICLEIWNGVVFRNSYFYEAITRKK